MPKKYIEVDGVRFVPESATNATDTSGKPYVVIRSKDSGCHAGFLEAEDGNTITLVHSRRLWFWSGAASLSQLAQEGVKSPDSCKFPQAVPSITVYGCCEKIPSSEQARESIEGVKPWKK